MRYLSLVLASALVISLSACGGKDTNEKDGKPGVPKVQENDVRNLPSTISLPQQWANTAKKLATEGGGEVIGKVTPSKGPGDVVRVGTLTSWTDETIEMFAIRAARMMRGMSQVTPYTYCGNICKVPGAPDGPFAIDILTQKQAASCFAVPVCSIPNGSGITNYGETTGDILLINATPKNINPVKTNNKNRTYDAPRFNFVVAPGKDIKISVGAPAHGYYVMASKHILQVRESGRLQRTIHDFAQELDITKSNGEGAAAPPAAKPMTPVTAPKK